MENDIEQARASNMENDIEQARASNMENDIEQARASNMENDIVEKLDNELRSLAFVFDSVDIRMAQCIYRVPQALRDVNSNAYTPALISIGPLHRGHNILAMGREKLKYFEKLTERNGMDNKKRCDIVISIKNQEEHLRSCYSEKFYEIKSNDFVEMILLDAVFIIEFLLESNAEKGPKRFKPRMTFDIREDLMLLENQLPLSIIEKIYDQVSYHSSDNKHKSFLDLATWYLKEYLHLQVVETSPGVEVETSPGVKRSGHCTDLLRNLMLRKTSPDVEKGTSLGEKRSRHCTDLLRNLMWFKTSPGVEKETSTGVKKETSPDVETGTSTGVKKETSPDVETGTSTGVKKETSPDVETGTSTGVKKETSPDVEKGTSLGEKRSRHCTDLLRNLMWCKTSPGVEKETSTGVKKETSPDVETGTSTGVKKETSPDVETGTSTGVKKETSPDVETGTSTGVKKETSPDVEKGTSLGEKRSRHCTDLLRNLMWCKTSPGVEKETSTGVKKETSPDVETGTSTGVKKETSPDVETGTSTGVKKETSPDVETGTSTGVNKETSPDVETGTSTGVNKETSPDVETGTSTDVKKETSPDVETGTSTGVKKETSPDVETGTSTGVKKETSPDVETGTSTGVKKETSPDVETGTSTDVKKEPRHLTDLLRNLMLSRAIQRTYRPDIVKLKYNATMLHKAGVTFQVTRDKCLVNIKFDKGVLKIPHLKVDHNFERLVRNIMGMEQCLYEGEAYICSYIKFMDQLIDTAGDVGLLVENGIILHWLGDDAAVSKMINNLCTNIGDNDTCFGDISKALNDHYENRCNHTKATLKLVYFPNIWRGTGIVVAAILLILTLIQTINSFK